MVEIKAPPSLSGDLTDFGHRLSIRVYFEDTDFSGVVYHARYLHFFERGRSDFLRLKGIHHRDLEKGAFGKPLYFVVKTMELDFLSPARIDDVVRVDTSIESSKGARLFMRQSISRDDYPIATAHVTVVLINEMGKPQRLPDALSSTLVA